MSSPAVRFEVVHQDGSATARGRAARTGILGTAHGTVRTPAFMPVGTRGSVKGLTPDQVRATGAEIILANTYHLALRPTAEVVAQLGGLHEFMGWTGPILTDSGGFQVFSLADSARVEERGVTFKSHIDGAMLEFTPERAVEIQELLGSDIAMVLDHVVALPSQRGQVGDAMERSVRWASRCQRAARRDDQSLFAIVQGGLERDLRLECAEQLIALDFPGYAIGGLSVGESPEQMYEVLDYLTPILPPDKPRYLMGVGQPRDLVEAIARGVDMFDCVMPTRNGRNGMAFTDEGPIRLRNQCHALDRRPLDADTPSLASNYSRGYLRHLFMAGEMLGPILVSAHNLAYYQRLLAEARAAIAEDRYVQWAARKIENWSRGSSDLESAADPN